MRQIKIKNSTKFILVDDKDFERLNQYTWLYSNGRAYSTKGFFMHHLLINLETGKMVDHIDGNGLNNQKHNLRVATNSQNQANSKLSRKSSSGYKGVSFSRNRRNWRAVIQVNKTRIWLGSFNTKEEAALAYNKAASSYFGNYSRPNNIKD